ncbi:MAG: helix-turn-helix domain-containing protein [Thiobacillus sp.]
MRTPARSRKRPAPRRPGSATHGGRIASALGVTERTLYRKLKRYGLR